MIEVVFSESARGGLCLAQSYGSGLYLGGAVGVIIHHEDGSEPTSQEIEEAQRVAEEQERKRWEEAIPLGGSPGDVFGFSLGLSFGDIREPVISEKRIEAIQILYSIWDEMLDKQEREKLEQVESDLTAIRKRLSEGEDIRIWYSDNPEELCGFYWLMDKLRHLPEHHGMIHAIKLPEFEEKYHEIIRYTSWGEMDPGQFGCFQNLTKPLSDLMRKIYADAWKQLQEENSLIRACINGELRSAPDDLYDRYIQKEIDAQDQQFREAVVIGGVLGKYRLGVSDGYLHHRIEKMVHDGKLEVLTQPKEGYPSYHRILKKV